MDYYKLTIEQDEYQENPLLDFGYLGQGVIPYLGMEDTPYQDSLPEHESERLSLWEEGDSDIWDILETVCDDPTHKMEALASKIARRFISEHILLIPVYMYQQRY